MQPIQDHISLKQQELSSHPFLAGLRCEPSLERALWFAPQTTFWAMGFQDVIRLNAERVEDVELARIVRQHRLEDVGHDRWFIEDLKAIGRADLDLLWLYGEQCRATREATYAIAAECIHADHDVLRLVLILALEGAGHVMFGNVTRMLLQSGHQDRLKYFASSHLDVELAHDVFTTEVQRYMGTIAVSDQMRARCIGLVDRVFDAFERMAEGFVRTRPPASQ